jgi:cytochrome d ubiquinol oxidase subunit I
MRTAAAVSPGVDVAEVAITLAGFTLVYAALAVIEIRLLVKFVRLGPEPEGEPETPPADTAPALSY